MFRKAIWISFYGVVGFVFNLYYCPTLSAGIAQLYVQRAKCGFTLI